MKPAQAKYRQSQQGAALIVGLVFLLVLTMIGVSAIQTSTQEERMTGYALDNNASLQAAEAALREAEILVETAQEGSIGSAYYRDLGTIPDASTLANWTTATAHAVSTVTFNVGALNLVKSPPMYRIEKQHIKDISFKDATTQEPKTEIFMITTYSAGGSGNAPVVLQTAYRRIAVE